MSDPPRPSQDPLAEIIRAAGRREAPPEWAYERAFAAATLTWQNKLRRARWRKAISLAAGIAAVSVGMAIALYSFTSSPFLAQPIADVARVVGSPQIQADTSRQWIPLREHAGPLLAGAVLRTDAASAVALQLAEVSVRIAEDAKVILESKSRLHLVHGKIYIDTGATGVAGRVLVVTEATSVTDVGTRFEVQYREGDYRVRVREGEVLLQHDGRRERGVAGEQITIDDAGVVRIVPFANDDPAWRWIQALATAPDIDNQPLTTLLAWVARETGVAVRYASPAIERKANSTILHGSVRHLAPMQALTTMMATTDLQYELLADGTLMIK